jgi:threonine dehydrogenase-like Zn-dependent dehydrogenase
MKTMHGIWLEDKRISIRDDIPVPEMTPGEALIRVNIAGICATDLELVEGYYPFCGILGHEFIGKVELAPGHPEIIGKRVVGEINVSCGQCKNCLSGRKTHCVNRTALGILGRDGVFADYSLLPISNLHCVPDSLGDEEAVFTEPLAAALEILEQVHIEPSSRVLLVGAGRLGQLIAQVIHLSGCDLRVLARYRRQRDILVANHISICEESDLADGSYDVVIEATGSTDGYHVARQAVRPRGTIVLKSTYKEDFRMNISSVVVDEIRLVGSRCGPFPPALRLLKNHDVDVTSMIDERFYLNNGLKAFDKARQPGILKVLLECN